MIGQPVRQPRGALKNASNLGRWVRREASNSNVAAVLVIFDTDSTETGGQAVCPKTLGPELRRDMQSIAGDTPVFVVLASREFEAWLLAGVEGLRGFRGIDRQARAPASVEEIRDSKGRLRTPAGGYSPTVDQAKFCARFDMGWAHRRSRSFRKLWNDMDTLLRQLEYTPAVPPLPGHS